MRRARRAGHAGRAVGIACLLDAALAATTAGALELQAHRGGRGLWPENTLAAFGEEMRAQGLPLPMSAPGAAR